MFAELVPDVDCEATHLVIRKVAPPQFMSEHIGEG
jgi:hypothetical protein